MVKQHILDRQQNRIGRKRILVCAVSNECIDQITSKLKGFNDKIGELLIEFYKLSSSGTGYHEHS